MNVSDIVVNDVRSIEGVETVGKLRGAFADPAVKAVPVTDDGAVVGIVSRRDLLSSHELPSRKVRSITRSVPTITRETDVREAARLMTTGDTPILPVIERETFVGVLRLDDLLRHVKRQLATLSAADVATTELITVRLGERIGRTLATFRENKVQHLPVVADTGGNVVGIVSLHDVLEFVTREISRPAGGRPPEGPPGGGHFGGFGAREGERERLLDLPVQQVMIEPVVFAPSEATAATLVDLMLERNVSSVVVQDGGEVTGIVTKTDLLEALTWTPESPYYIHVFGVDNMTELTWEALSAQIADLVRKDRRLRLLEAKVHFHRHKETARGRPLIMVRIRLFTDRGMFVGSGEGFGDRHAFSLALDVVRRQLLEAKRPTREDRSRAHLAGGEWEPVPPGVTGA